MKRPRTILLLTLTIVAGYSLARAPKAAWSEVTLGEAHEVNFPADQAFQLTEDVMRGDGILFDPQQAEDTLITLWKPADNPATFFGSLAGQKPRYRYEVTVTPLGPKKSRIIVNVRTEYVPDAQVQSYQASRRFDLFHQIDKLAATLPPPSTEPSEGGVNFALLPHEDLKGLAKRVTGSAANWQAIASANGLKSESEVTPFQTIWVPNRLLKNQPRTAVAPPGDPSQGTRSQDQ
jgi:hypothetical protein